MNVLFLTLTKITSLSERGIYTDLLRHFSKGGHNIYVVSPLQRRDEGNTELIKDGNTNILRVKSLNLQKCSSIEKGIGQLILEYQYTYTIKRYFSKVKFDLIIYPTPPITFTRLIKYYKKKHSAFTYLLLKDIFPQNAVDLGMINKTGLIYKYFRNVEKKLYELSDKIGCMSQANKDFLLKHNPDICESKVEVNPNSITPILVNLSSNEIKSIRLKHNIALDKKIFIYGGNLGKPQGIDFLLEIISKNKNDNIYFLIVGAGTEFLRVEQWFLKNKPLNARLLRGLRKNDYDELLSSCDVGMIFLNKDFSIPNFPSRLLSYLEMKLPVFAATDTATDIGKVIEEFKCGFWVESGDIKIALDTLDKFLEKNTDEFKVMKTNSEKLLKTCYLSDYSYRLIINSLSSV